MRVLIELPVFDDDGEVPRMILSGLDVGEQVAMDN
jgi:hypothetical protein